MKIGSLAEANKARKDLENVTRAWVRLARRGQVAARLAIDARPQPLRQLGPRALEDRARHLRVRLAADALTSTTWLDSLRRRHLIATGVESGAGHVGSGAYRSNDDQFIHAGPTRDEVAEAGLAPEDRLDFQNSANPMIEGELREWLARTGQTRCSAVVEVRGVREYIEGLGPAKEPWHARAMPINRGAEHDFPHPRAVPAYRHLSGERVVEAWDAVKKAAPGSRQDPSAIRVALHALADYYHTLINAHLFVRVNNSLVMTEVNSFLKWMGLNEVEHGHLDIFAFNLGYRDFRMYFEDFVRLGQRSILRYGVLSMEGRLIRVPFSGQLP